MTDSSIVVVGAKGFWSRRHFLRDLQLPLEPVFDLSLSAEPSRQKVWGLVAADQKIDGTLMDLYPNLRTIARTGTGYDAIDIAAARKRGITVTRVAKLNAEAVKEFVLAFILDLCKDVSALHSSMLAGSWKSEHESRRLGELTVGVVGLGMIGQALTRALHHLGARRVVAWNRTMRPEIETLADTAVIEILDLDTVLQNSDIVVVALALTDETRGLISAEKLALMRPEAFLINVSRGAVVDEMALARAVAEGRLAGVALDVYSHEPPEDPFCQPYMRSLLESARMGKRVILTPHCAGKTHRSVDRISKQVAHNLAGVWVGDLTDVEVV